MISMMYDDRTGNESNDESGSNVSVWVIDDGSRELVWLRF